MVGLEQRPARWRKSRDGENGGCDNINMWIATGMVDEIAEIVFSFFYSFFFYDK